MLLFVLGFAAGMAVLAGGCALAASIVEAYGDRG